MMLFGPFDLNFGARKEIVYRLAMPITKAQADKLVSAKALDYYASPPVVLGAESDVSSLKSGLFSVPKVEVGQDNVFIFAAAGLVIFFILFMMLILGAAAVYYFFIRKKKK